MINLRDERPLKHRDATILGIADDDQTTITRRC
jgi:hypothetical protein